MDGLVRECETISQAVLSGIGMGREGYAFAAGVFFLCCFAMSLASRLLERRLATGVRQPRRATVKPGLAPTPGGVPQALS